MPPSSEIVERNIAALSGGPEEWRQRKAEHAEKRRARRALLLVAQQGHYESTVLEGPARLEAEIARRSHERRLGLRRAHTERLRARRARWAVLAVVTNGASVLHAAVIEGRRMMALRREEDRAARIFQKIWRCYLITVRLAKLLKGRKLLRRGVYWWRVRLHPTLTPTSTQPLTPTPPLHQVAHAASHRAEAGHRADPRRVAAQHLRHQIVHNQPAHQALHPSSHQSAARVAARRTRLPCADPGDTHAHAMHAPCHTHANAHAIHTPMHTCQCTCQCACHMLQVVLVWWGACDYKNRVSALPCARRLQLYAPRLQPYAPMLQPCVSRL